MMKMLKLTNNSGTPVWINIDQIQIVRPNSRSTTIFFAGSDDDSTEVREPAEQLVEMIEQTYARSPRD